LGGGLDYGNGLAINNTGQVAGNSAAAGNIETHATIWNGTTATDLGTLGGAYSQAYAINNAGLVVGVASTAGDLAYHATLWNGTVAKDLDTFSRLDGFSSTANAINNNGQVVGWATNTNNDQCATLWDSSTTTDLNSFLDGVSSGAGWKLISANGINDKGAIVGTAYNYQTFQMKGFLLSVPAVPEPETYAMMLVGFGLIGSVLRRRKTS
jgi:probable HAF family extracellular repeat protein